MRFFFLFDCESGLSQISCFPSTFIITGVLKSHEMELAFNIHIWTKAFTSMECCSVLERVCGPTRGLAKRTVLQDVTETNNDTSNMDGNDEGS